jgi:Copine/C2 domain
MRCEMTLHAKKLRNIAGVLKGTSDPFAVVTHLGTAGEPPKCLGRTEEASNNLSPDWQYVFRFSYDFGCPTKLCVTIFDHIRNDYKNMGSAIFDVGEVLGQPGASEAKRLKQGGVIIAHIRKGTSSGELRLKIKGHHLTNVEGFMKKSDPFFELHKRAEDEDGFITWEKIYSSKVIKDTLNPCWPELVMDLATFCGGDLNLQVKLIVFDHEKKGNHDSMGETTVTVNRLFDACTDGKDDSSQALVLKLKGKSAGKIIVLESHVSGISDNYDEMAGVKVRAGGPAKIDQNVKGTPNFMDYAVGGCEFNTIVAIDFNGSNGHPDSLDSYHYMCPDIKKRNDYEKAIISLLSILGKFDTDKYYSILGFGAKYNGEVYDVFQCGKEKLVSGTRGVLKTYRDQFKSGITMAHTPTVFTKIIKTASAHARKAAVVAESIGQQAYTILIVLTDGDVHDIEEISGALDEAVKAPLSIVFVGIGNEEFPGMNFIDDGRMERTRRDIAQFVEFNRHYCRHGVKFAFEALSEIPQQLVDYFQSKKIDPLPEIPVHFEELIARANEKAEAEENEVVYSFDKNGSPTIVRGGELNICLFSLKN